MSMYRVTSRGLNLRTLPHAGQDSAVLLVLPAGAEVTLAPARRVVAGWSRVTWRLAEAEASGWVAARHLEPSHFRRDPAPWMEHARAALARGVREIPGAEHHPEIVRYHQRTSLRAQNDETAWCSAFACDAMELAGIRSTRSAAARSWLSWGRALDGPVPGCVVVLARGSNPAQGHVGFLDSVGEAGRRGAGMLYLLGGNQGNAVSIAPYRMSQLLGYRWPEGVPLPA